MGASLTTETQSAFFAALAERRAAVLASLRDFAQADALARCVHELVSDAAGQGASTLESATARAALEAAELPLDAPVIDGATLDAVFTEPASHGDAISALIAEGLRLALADLGDAAARREAITTAIRLLPGIERLGPFVISDFVDAALSEADAALFWQLYVDRVVAEVKRHTRAARPPKEPWMLLALLRVHRAGPGRSGAPAWGHLRLHINRALQAARHRWRFIRQLAEDSNDVELLHFLCGSAAMVDDPETLVAFLERGDARLISCALFTLQIRGGHRGLVEQIVSNLAARPLPEVGGRLVEIHAQLHALAERTPALDDLVTGIQRMVQTQVAQGARLDSLLEAVSDDPRALRQSILLADAVPPGVTSPSPQLRHLLERVIGVWFQAFTPGGVAHPFNDDAFRAAVRRAAVVAFNDELRARFVAFAAGLGPFARKWAKGREDWDRLKQRFVWAFGQLVLPMAAELAARPAGVAHAQALYEALVRLYLAHPGAREAGWLGAVESVVPAMFADLLVGDPADERVSAAAALVAEVEVGLRGATPAEGVATLDAEAGIERPVVRAAVRVVDRTEATVPSLLATVSGWAAVRDLGRRIGRLIGWRETGEAVVAGDSLLVRAGRSRRGEALDERVERIALDALSSLEVRRPLLGLHLVAGASALVGAAAYGGVLAFTGIRSADTGLALMGAGIIGAGLVFDAAAQALASRAREKVLVSLAAGAEPVIIEVDTRTGAAMLDALMAADARRRELALYASLSSKDTAWGEAPDSDDDAEVDAAAESDAAGIDLAPAEAEPAAPAPPVPETAESEPPAPEPPAPATAEPETAEPALEPPAPEAAESEPPAPEPPAPAPRVQEAEEAIAAADAPPALPPLPKKLPRLPGRTKSAGPPRDVDRE